MKLTNIQFRKWLEQFPDDASIEITQEFDCGFGSYNEPVVFDVDAVQVFEKDGKVYRIIF